MTDCFDGERIYELKTWPRYGDAIHLLLSNKDLEDIPIKFLANQLKV